MPRLSDDNDGALAAARRTRRADAVLLDMRTLMGGDDDTIVSALCFAAGRVS